MPKPSKPNPTLSKARALLNAGKPAEAAALLSKMLGKSPHNTAACELLAEVAFRQGAAASAVRLLQTVIAAQPDNVPALNKIAVALAVQAKFAGAAEYLRRAIALDPACFSAHLDLCKVAREMGLLDESIAAGEKAVDLQPDDPRAHGSVALSYERFGWYQQAHDHYLRAAALAPDDIARQYACAVSHVSMGEKSQAREILQHVVELQGDHAAAHWRLARLSRCTSHQDTRVKQLESLLDTPGRADSDRVYLHFALGKMYQDCAHYDQAFAHFSAGNRLESAQHEYHPKGYSDYVDALAGNWTRDRLSALQSAGADSQVPLFIVGLPRSGTTLVEQILAAHPAVYGAGELSWFTQAEQDLAAFTHSNHAYPACVAAFQAQHVAALAEKYLAYLAALSGAGSYRYITDKMPSNYERIGLIAALFPRARIIHCRRDPLDNAVSQYSLLFQGSLAHSHDLYNLGSHYRHYQRLMTHWQSLLPERIMPVDYEKLVTDHPTEIRRLLAWLDLPWDDNCLTFFDSKRVVRTASDFQVRTPIYTSAVGRWRHYEKFLGPLRRGLAGEPK